MKTSWARLCGLVVAAVLAAGCTETAAVESVVPADGATGVAIRPDVVVTFNVEIDPESITSGTFTLVNAATGAPVAGSVEAGGMAATFRPAADLAALTEYTAKIEGATALYGDPMPAPHTWTFRTGSKPLKVASTSPTSGANNVAQDAIVSITFDAPVDASTVNASSFTVTAGTAVSGTRSVSGATLTFTPAEPMPLNTTHTVTVTTSVLGAAGEVLAAHSSFTFKTASAPVTGGVAGYITFDAINADSTVEGGGTPRLDYGNVVARPARRVVVEGWENNATAPVASVLTDDSGYYKLPIPDGTAVTVRAYAWSKTSGYTVDSTAPNHCTGGSWDIRVVDNTQNKAQWSMYRPTLATAPAGDINLHAPTVFNGSSYTARTGAPFFLIDQAVSALERVCEGNAAPALPLLYMNWSPNNVSTASGDKPNGLIGTSHYTMESGVSNLYILGKEDSDTDEYDDHVVVHEFGHYLEDRLYRSDSIGGPHSFSDVLDPRVAFGEGYGNALSGIVLADPVYVDTSGTNQQNGFDVDVSAAPVGNARGVYSESSMQHLLYMLWDNRDVVPASGSYARIHTILASDHTVTQAFTCGQTFAAYYNARWGDADGLYLLWGTTLDSPTASLCAGSCSGSAGGTADVWDVDNDLGIRYAASRSFDGARDAEFWRLYKLLSGGGITSPTQHEQLILFGSGANKLGMQRWYRYVGTGGAATFTIANAMNGGTNTCAGTDNLDLADLWIFDAGEAINDFIQTNLWEGLTGRTCEQVSEATLTSGRTYVLTVSRYQATTGLTSYQLTVQ